MPSTSEGDLVWEQVLCRDNQGKIRSLEWTLIQYDGWPMKKGSLDIEWCWARRLCEETQGEDCCSFAKLCPTLCDLMDCSTRGFLVLHCLPEFVQIQVHWVTDAIQPSHPLPPSSPPPLNLSQHQGLMSQLFTSGGQSIGASALASLLWIHRVDFL